MAKRKSWEKIFVFQYLRPVFEQTDDLIESTREQLNKNLQQNKLEKLVYEIPDADDATESDVDATLNFHSPFLWNYRINITLTHLRRTLEGFFPEDKSEGALLKLLLNETDLSCIQHLPKLLSLQKSMIHRYQRKAEENEVEKISIKDYCKENNRVVSDDDFKFYIQVWNQVHASFPKQSSETVRNVEMSMESPVSMCLPSYIGQGRRALLMMEHLVEKQNNFLLKCKEIIVPSPSFPEISVDQMTEDDLMCIDFEKSLMPLVLANSQYEYSVGDTGSRHKIVYRYAILEKQITEKFILNKKLLNIQSLPRIKYLHDIGLGKNCEDMRKSVPQVAQLPQRLSLNLDDLCAKNRFSDICSSIWTLSTVIGYLAKYESDQNKSLISYVTDNLMMDVDETVVIPPAAQLKHTMTLFERLSWQRSKHFVERDQNPFKNLRNFSEDERCEVSDEVIEKSLQRIDLKKLQLELNSMIFLTHHLYPESSLGDNLLAYVESKGPDEEVIAEVKRWSEMLPEELRVKDAPKLFKIAVGLEPEK